MALNCVKAGVGCGACKRQNIDIPYPRGGVGGRPNPVRIRHVIPPHLARRRVSTDLIPGAPAPSPAHHDRLRGLSWPCQLIEAQVRELPLDWFLRTPAGRGAGGVSPWVT